MGILGKWRGAGGAKRVPAQADPPVWPGQRSRVGEVAKAAGVGVVRIRCHATTWDYLAEQAKALEARSYGSRPEAFRPATGEEIDSGADGIVTVPLGGSSLAALFDWCFEAQSIVRTDLERGVGRRVGRAISEALEHLATTRDADDQAAVIWLDDRIATDGPVSVQS